jgi:phosphatidylserine decarboxylase
MSESLQATSQLELETLDPTITSIQPGGGICMAIELAWGRLRRWWLKTFRPSYVRRMKALRICDPRGCPHEVVDPRDVKYFRNQTGDCWRSEDDPFAWRDRLPFVRVGLGELVILTTGCLLVAAALWVFFWPLAMPLVLAAALIVWFFRDPQRAVPTQPGLVVAPADGKIVSIERIDHDPFLEGPAVQIGIFLSVFNVHLNRSPVASRVIGLTYSPGKFLNALRPRSAQENEQLALRLQETQAPYRRYIVRQIAGAIARRIVCWVRPGDVLARGARFGMIKLGSRTELILPTEDGQLEIRVRIGQHVKAGFSEIARYR